MKMRYALVSPSDIRVTYLFSSKGLLDSEFLNYILSFLSVSNGYTVTFTDVFPKGSPNRLWYFGHRSQNGLPDFVPNRLY